MRNSPGFGNTIAQKPFNLCMCGAYLAFHSHQCKAAYKPVVQVGSNTCALALLGYKGSFNKFFLVFYL